MPNGARWRNSLSNILAIFNIDWEAKAKVLKEQAAKKASAKKRRKIAEKANTAGSRT